MGSDMQVLWYNFGIFFSWHLRDSESLSRAYARIT